MTGAGLTYAVPAEGEVRIALIAAFHEIGGGDPSAVHAQDRTAAEFRDHIVGDQRGAGAPRDRHRDPDIRPAYDVSRRRNVPQILPVTKHEARRGCVLD